MINKTGQVCAKLQKKIYRRMSHRTFLVMFFRINFLTMVNLLALAGKAESIDDESQKIQRALELQVKEVNAISTTNSNDWASQLALAKLNALRIALRFPDTELSKTIYAYVVEDEIVDKQEKKIFQEALELAKKGDTASTDKLRNDSVVKAKKLAESRWDRWMNEVRPIIAKFVFAGIDGEFYIPDSVTLCKNAEGDVTEEDNEEALSFCGVKIGTDAGLDFKEDKYISASVKEKFLGSNQIILHIVRGKVESAEFCFIADNVLDFRRLLERAVDEITTLMHCDNRCFGFFSEKNSKLLRGGLYFNVIRKNARYCVRIDQEHWLDLNRPKHAVGVKVMFGNVITRKSCQSQNAECEATSKNDAGLQSQKKIVDRRASAAWIRKNVKSINLSQYSGPTQIAYRNKLNQVIELTAAIAVAYMDKNNKETFNRCAKIINEFYSSRRAWSCLGIPEQSIFDDRFDEILKLIKNLIDDNDEACVFKERYEKLWLNCVCHVNTWEELDQKIAAEKEAERKRKEEREYLLRLRKVRAEEDRNAILNDIRNSIDNLPHY